MLPKKINPCPISESVFEVRYSSTLPSDAIFGILYGALAPLFPDGVESLPVSQIPDAVRSQDPNLKYAPLYKMKSKNLSLLVGPRSITFSNVSPYMGWEDWSGYFKKAIEAIKTTKVMSHIERTGLRYINIFEERIIENIELSIKIKDNAIKNESTMLRTELLDSGIIKILQINNDVDITIGTTQIRGSIIDIDCLANLSEDADTFFGHYESIIEMSHQKEKELFFDLLKPEMLAKLNPEY